MKTIKVANVYGYPSLSPEFRKWASGRVDLAIGVHNIEKAKRRNRILVVVSGLAYLSSSGVPIMGWHYTPGTAIWTRTQLPDVDHLPDNEARIQVPAFKNVPTSKQLFDYYVNDVDGGLPPAFLNINGPACYNDRVFNSKTTPLT